MLVSKKKYNSLKEQKDEIIDQLKAEIRNQEEKLQDYSERLKKLADEIIRIKSSTASMVEMLEYDANDIVIPNIANFLIEEGNKEAAKVISKCKIYKVSIDKARLLLIELHCPGDCYDILQYQGFPNTNELNIQINSAFNKYYSYSHVSRIFDKASIPTSRVSEFGRLFELELSMRRIDPKESDIEKFFEKVEKLKKQLKEN